MAYITSCNCRECGKHYQGDPMGSGFCGDCYAKKEYLKKQKFLLTLRHGKTLDERIAYIEEWIYDHNKDHPSNPIVYG